jgi:diguanylate cyclase (GGDEF)-like protein
MLDLDQLRHVNDHHGHASGDAVLIQIADRLTHLGAPVRAAARLSADEFALLIGGNLDQAHTAAWRAWQAIADHPVVVGGQPLVVRTSIGVSCARPGMSTSQLLHHANLATHRAKAAGARVHAHTPDQPDQPVTPGRPIGCGTCPAPAATRPAPPPLTRVPAPKVRGRAFRPGGTSRAPGVLHFTRVEEGPTSHAYKESATSYRRPAVIPGRLAALAASLAATILLLCAGAVASCAPLTGWMSTACPPDQQPTSGDAGDGCDPSVLQRWDAEQVANATTIVQVGADLQVSIWGRVIAVAVAMQESSLRNLPHLGEANDHDSIGLFQQRPSQGWGSPAQLQDPAYAATTFYHALLAFDGWAQMSLAEAGQAVQRSAHPDAYTRWTSDAATLVAILSADAAGWVQPLHGPLVSGFGPRGGSLHAGVDLTAPRGSIIVAASAGTVATVVCNAWHVDGSWWGCDRDGHPQTVQGCGWYVDLIHVGGVLTRYCHLDTRPWVEVGQQVTAGQPIGLVGTTGHSSGPHLHYEVRLRDEAGAWTPIDAEIFMRQVGAPLG